MHINYVITSYYAFKCSSINIFKFSVYLVHTDHAILSHGPRLVQHHWCEAGTDLPRLEVKKYKMAPFPAISIILIGNWLFHGYPFYGIFLLSSTLVYFIIWQSCTLLFSSHVEVLSELERSTQQLILLRPMTTKFSYPSLNIDLLEFK